MYKIEFLATIDTSNGTGSSIESLVKIVDASNDLSVDGGYLILKEEKAKMVMKRNKVEDSDFCVYSILLSSESSELQEVSRALRKILSPLASSFQELKNDLAADLAAKMYPRVFNLENRMRALISKFMTNNLGPEWYLGTLPKAVKDSRAGNKNQLKTQEVLYHLDFIHLSHFLLKPYSSHSMDNFQVKVHKLLKGFHRMDKEDIEGELEKFKMINNWDRYFSNVFNVDSKEIEKLWAEAYSLRCKIAHSHFINVEEYQKGIRLIDKLESILDDAISKVDKIVVPEDEKDLLEYANISSAAPEAEPIIESLKHVRNAIIRDLNPPRISGITSDALSRISDVVADVERASEPIRELAEQLKESQRQLAIAIPSFKLPEATGLALVANDLRIRTDSFFSNAERIGRGLYVDGGYSGESFQEEE